MIEEPKAEKCMAALADILSTLSGVRPGGWVYPRTPSVDRIVPPFGSQMSSDTLPRLYVCPGRGGQLKGENKGGIGIAHRTYQHALHVDIHGIAEATTGVLADTWRWRLRDDVLDALHLNLTVMGLAQGMDFDERPEEVDAGEIAPKVWFLQPVTVWLLNQYATAT